MAFDEKAYAAVREGAQRSARAIVPYVQTLVRARTVADVGCGEGWFAHEFALDGCQVDAFDASVEVPRFKQWPREAGGGRINFFPADLAGDAWAYELGPEKRDLCVSLEVAEHLPAVVAAGFVRTLCAVAPVVLFSAAVPGQGGHRHVNEQPPQFWADLFAESGLVCTEDLRWVLWADDTVEPWYRQNLLLFARPEWLRERGLPFTTHPLHVVHPAIFAHHVALARR